MARFPLFFNRLKAPHRFVVCKAGGGFDSNQEKHGNITSVVRTARFRPTGVALPISSLQTRLGLNQKQT